MCRCRNGFLNVEGLSPRQDQHDTSVVCRHSSVASWFSWRVAAVEYYVTLSGTFFRFLECMGGLLGGRDLWHSQFTSVREQSISHIGTAAIRSSVVARGRCARSTRKHGGRVWRAFACSKDWLAPKQLFTPTDDQDNLTRSIYFCIAVRVFRI